MCVVSVHASVCVKSLSLSLCMNEMHVQLYAHTCTLARVCGPSGGQEHMLRLACRGSNQRRQMRFSCDSAMAVFDAQGRLGVETLLRRKGQKSA